MLRTYNYKEGEISIFTQEKLPITFPHCLQYPPPHLQLQTGGIGDSVGK